MRGSLSSFKKHPLIPAIALMASVFLLTGQTFNCCRINETIAGKIAAAWSHWSSSESASASIHEEESGHPHCHGHGSHAETAHSSGEMHRDFDSGSTLAEDGTCLSERIETGKPMLAGDFAFTPASTMVARLEEGKVPALPFRPVSPRPQNKSSPPLYLTTLRILV
ncbi:MAG: hypothetical protein JWO30_154 [Fibrobacteres bacterium]|nr:hypothetical protein [Fibrobacterota bacterium]